MADETIKFGGCDFSKDISVGKNQLEQKELKDLKFLFDEIGAGKIDISDGIDGKEAKILFEAMGGSDGVLTDEELMRACTEAKGEVTLEQVQTFKKFLQEVAGNFQKSSETTSTNKDQPVDNNDCDKGEVKTVTVEKWGTGKNDCLSRILAAAYPDVKPYSEEWYKLETMVMNANPEIYGDENGNGGRKRIIDGTRHNAVIHPGDQIKLPPFNSTEATVKTETPSSEKPKTNGGQGSGNVTTPDPVQEPPVTEPPVTDPPAEDPPGEEKDPVQEYIDNFLKNGIPSADEIRDMINNRELTFAQKRDLLSEMAKVNSNYNVKENVSIQDFYMTAYNIAQSSSKDGSTPENRLELLRLYTRFCHAQASKDPEVQDRLLLVYDSCLESSVRFADFARAVGYTSDSPGSQFIDSVMGTGDKHTGYYLLKVLNPGTHNLQTKNSKEDLEDKYLDRGGFLGFGKKSNAELLTKILKDYTNQNDAKLKMSADDVVYLLNKLFKNNMMSLYEACTPEQRATVAKIFQYANDN